MLDSLRRARPAQIALWLALAAIAIATRWRWGQLVGVHTPFVEWDTQVFQQIADLPFGPELLVSSKPLVVPLVYRAAHNDGLQIIGIQAELSFWAWAIWTASVVHAVQRRWVRLLAAGIGAAFVLDPTRIGFTGSLMPESINDSVLALAIAGAVAVVRLTGRARIAAAVATGVVALAWLLTRDTNAVIAVAAAGLAILVWRRWRSRWAWGLALLTAACSAFALWTASVTHPPLPFQRAWPVAFTSRAGFPLANNVLMRAVPDEPADVPPDVAKLKDGMQLVLAGPDAQPSQDWVAQHGAAHYRRWLLRHPIDRIVDVVRDRWRLLRGNLVRYMPGHWVAPSEAPLRTLTFNRWVLRLLLLLGPFLMWRPSRDGVRGLALCIAVSGVLGIFASYYGDAVELTRHTYGAAQQLIIGLFLAVIAWLDQARRPRRGPEVG